MNGLGESGRRATQIPPWDGDGTTTMTAPVRSYNRSWDEIEAMLDAAEDQVREWKDWFEQCKEVRDRDGMKEAARNYKALEGVVKTLKWVLGEKGIDHPLE